MYNEIEISLYGFRACNIIYTIITTPEGTVG